MLYINRFSASGVPAIERAGGHILDARLYYRASDLHEALADMGSSGRVLYEKLLSRFDAVFPWACALFGVLFLRGLRSAGVRMLRWLWVVPFIGAAMDVLENHVVLAALRAYPSPGPWDAWAGPFTLMKWLGYGSAVALIGFGAVNWRLNLQAKTNSQRKYGTSVAR
jgi:hypothetical protein